jgi:hypothetical protein
VNVAGPPSVWNLSVSTPEGVRLKSKFSNAVKYLGPVLTRRPSACSDMPKS